MALGTVRSLGLTPLKGAAHSHPNRISVRCGEIAGDRRWALIQAHGRRWRIVRTVETPLMMTVRARPASVRSTVAGGLWLDMPDGETFLVPAPDGPTLAAEYWGRETLVRPAPGPWDAALSSLLARDVRLVAVERAGAVVYAQPVSIVTTSSLREIAGRAGDDALDGDRFRSSVVLDTPELPAFVEDSWIGRRLRVGGVELLVRQRLARCGVIRVEPSTGRSSGPDVLQLLAADRTAPSGIVFGVGADVIAPGEIAVGDAVSAVDG